MQESAVLVTAIACWEQLGLAKALSGTLDTLSKATGLDGVTDRHNQAVEVLIACRGIALLYSSFACRPGLIRPVLIQRLAAFRGL